ncbi:MAG: tripartite tricarboxylate transporter substrate binding protein [Spirochaetales bacterium]|nr:tripartite tricarboxylate transporter substrate binding protein [Spirochaetales bacterium]
MRKLLVLLAVLLLCAGLAFGEGTTEYPARDITNVLVWAAGGGTDTCNRIVMAEMAKILGVNINVTNVTGGVGGSVGMLDAYSRPHDGYTICGLSESIVTAGVQGGWDKRVNVWDYFIIGGSPDVVSVTASAPYQTFKELIDAAKAAPGSIKAGASASGSIHHLNLLALEKGSGAKFNFIPYTGSAPAQNAAMTGEVTVVVTSVAEQAQLIRGGQLRPLAVLVPNDFQFENKVFPTAFKSVSGLDQYLPISQAIGFAVPQDTPQNVKEVLWDAFDKAMDTPAVKEFGQKSFYVLSGATGKEANDTFDNLESTFAWTLWELGAAKVNPATLGIPKP